MKTAHDPRHQKRTDIVKSLFSLSFGDTTQAQKINDITNNLTGIDEKIRQAAPQWPLPKIAKIDLAILRLAVYELYIEKKAPPKVIIDEAIELAKEFGNDASPSFINGVLGTVLKDIQQVDTTI